MPNTLSFNDFQNYDIRVGKILSIENNKVKIDIGKIVFADKISEQYISKKVIVFVKGNECKILYVNANNKEIPLTIDKEIKEGAKVR